MPIGWAVGRIVELMDGDTVGNVVSLVPAGMGFGWDDGVCVGSLLVGIAVAGDADGRAVVGRIVGDADGRAVVGRIVDG
jgi:hypothetical protein